MLRFVVLAGLAGCYEPSVATNVPCSADLTCPRAQQCDLRASPPVCVDFVPGIDADTDAAPDGSSDFDAPELDAGRDAASDAPAIHTIPNGAVLWLKFDDNPADGATDSAGAHAATCASCPQRVAGVHGTAYDFTAPNVISVAPTADLEPVANMTIAAWARLDASLTTTGAIACKNRATLCSYALLALANPDRAYYYATPGIVTGSPLVLGQWHHVALTWDGTTLRGYLDGVADGQAAVASLTSDAAMPLMIGAKGDSNPANWNGAIDDLVLYRRLLTAAEIAQLATP